MAFCFKNTRKDIIMTVKDVEVYIDRNTCRFSEKNSIDKIRDHCHLTCKNKGPARITCNIIVTQQQSFVVPFTFHNFSKNDCHMFFKRFVDLLIDKVN